MDSRPFHLVDYRRVGFNFSDTKFWCTSKFIKPILFQFYFHLYFEDRYMMEIQKGLPIDEKPREGRCCLL